MDKLIDFVNWQNFESYSFIFSFFITLLAIIFTIFPFKFFGIHPSSEISSENNLTEPSNYLKKRLEDIKKELVRQQKWKSIFGATSFLLVLGQFIIGGVLATSVLQENLSKPFLSGMGFIVVISSLLRYYFRPDVKAADAYVKIAKLKSIIRNVEDQLFLIENKSPESLPQKEILKMMSNVLDEIENLDAKVVKELVTRPEFSKKPD